MLLPVLKIDKKIQNLENNLLFSITPLCNELPILIIVHRRSIRLDSEFKTKIWRCNCLYPEHKEQFRLLNTEFDRLESVRKSQIVCVTTCESNTLGFVVMILYTTELP